MSAIESLVNVAIGYGVAFGVQLAVFPIFGMNVTLLDNLWISAIFTAAPVVRSYLVRRLFNKVWRSGDTFSSPMTDAA